jgi:hypothetical protein
MVTKKFREKRELSSCCYNPIMRCIWQLNWETSDADEGFRELDQPTQQHTCVGMSGRAAAAAARWEEEGEGGTEGRGERNEEGVNRRCCASVSDGRQLIHGR